MTILDRDLKPNAKACHTIFHPSTNRGFMNEPSAVARDPSGGEETILIKSLHAHHPDMKPASGPQSKGDQERLQTIDEFWNEQEDAWW